jgi:hypothetical protein
MKKQLSYMIAFVCAVVLVSGVQTQARAQQNHWKDLVEMDFPGAYPTDEATARIRDEIDFQRASQAFLWALPAMNMYSMREGSEKAFGKGNHILPVWKGRLRATTQITTPNSDVIYAMSYIDLKDGPVVIDAPPMVQGLLDDFWQRPITDVGLPGPDKGAGGKYLLLPPDYQGELDDKGWYKGEDPADLYYTFKSRTYGVFLFWRAFLGDGGSTEEGVKTIEQTKVYPWGKEDTAPKMQFPDATHTPVKMLIPNVTKGDDPYRYFENLADFIGYEYVEREDFAMRGMLASIGIEKGKSFKPDARMKSILKQASIVGYNMSRANRYASRIPNAKIYPDRQYEQAYIGESPDFNEKTYLNLNTRAAFFHFAYSSSEAMVKHLVNKGSKYPLSFRDADGNFLMGQNSYKLHLPKDPPAKIFWSVAVYNSHNASGIDNGMDYPSINSKDDILVNKDGSVDFYFGPELPKGAAKSNWLKTNPDEGWFLILRLYGTMQAYYDQTWKPDDLVKLK